jgi:DNA invertase Pin-like site-specific DNA recombinase
VLKRSRYTDHGVSGTKTSRPGLDAMLSDVEPDQTIVVYNLDRLGRSSAHVAALIVELTGRRVFIESIGDGLNSSTPTGRAMLQMLASSRRWNVTSSASAPWPVSLLRRPGGQAH